ncbi:MAG: peptide/nickel transport system substrate-binding protein, partial [Thermomicrobiales bacterium]|jgi:peptide/nickel transport system substrate-binding protein|nr:peptide/nickel transport system substrate-binding protein [Thermomicrobiales bacterium]
MTRRDAGSNLLAAMLNRRRFLSGTAGAGVGLAGVRTLGAAPGPRSAGSRTRGQQGGTFTFAMWQSPDSLDPAVSGLISAGYVLGQVYESLIWHLPGLQPDKEFYPGLAESWEISPDAKEYTFHLRKDVKFHDGTPLTAEAIKVTYDHIVDPNTKSRSAVTALGPYDHTEIIDDYTAKIVFKEPNGAFLNTVAQPTFSPSSPAALQKYGADYGQNPVGTGPFMFKEWVVNDHVTLVRNPDYAWPSPAFKNQGPPLIDEIVFRIIPDAATRVNALKTGEVDMAENLPPQDVVGFQGDAGFQVFNASVTGMPYCIMVNAAKAPTDDLKVRQALQFATSQEQIVEALYQGVYEPSHNVFLPTTLGYDESLDAMYSYDPAKAAALLDEAGWVLDGDVRKKDGQELKLNFVNIANFGFDDISLLLQAQFQEIGIQAEISAESFPTVGETYNRGDHNLADFFYYAVDPYFMRALFNCDQIAAGFNWMHYCNPDLDALVQQGNSTGDAEQRAQIYAQAAKVAMEAAVVIPIYEQRAVFAGKTSIKDLLFSVNGMPYFHDVSLA